MLTTVKTVPNPRFNSCSVIISSDCNLSCEYCFQKENFRNKHMTPSMGEKVIDFLVEGATSTNNKHKNNNQQNPMISVMFFGGEPTLNIPTMRRMIEYAYQVSQEKKVSVSFSLDTNCTIWTDELEEFLNYWYNTLKQVSVQLSIDGCPPVLDHDRKWRFPNMSVSPAYQIQSVAKKYMEWAQRNNCSNMIYIRGSVSKFSLPYMNESYNYLRDVIGTKNIWFLPVHEEDWNGDDEIEFITQYRHITNRILNDTIELGDLSLYKGFSSCQLSPKQVRPCCAGFTFCTIDNDGTIYMCHRAQKPSQEKSIILGHIDHGIYEHMLDDKYSNITTSICSGYMNCGECENTNCKYCVAANYEVNGELTKGFPKYCAISMKEHEIRLELKKKLEENEKIKALMDQENKPHQQNFQTPDTSIALRELRNSVENQHRELINTLHQYKTRFELELGKISRSIESLTTMINRT